MNEATSDGLIRRNHELIAAAARARSDIRETELKAEHARAQASATRAVLPASGKATPDRELAIFGRARSRAEWW
jgi:hypothetical protein